MYVGTNTGKYQHECKQIQGPHHTGDIHTYCECMYVCMYTYMTDLMSEPLHDIWTQLMDCAHAHFAIGTEPLAL